MNTDTQDEYIMVRYWHGEAKAPFNKSLSSRANNCLHHLGLLTREDLRKWMIHNSLSRVRNVGKLTIQELVKWAGTSDTRPSIDEVVAWAHKFVQEGEKKLLRNDAAYNYLLAKEALRILEQYKLGSDLWSHFENSKPLTQDERASLNECFLTHFK